MFDSSAVWGGSGGSRYLCRVYQFFRIAPCCYEGCESVLLAEVKKFRKGRARGGLPIYYMEDDAAFEHVDVSCLQPQVVMLVTTQSNASKNNAERRDAKAQMLYGPFYVIDVINKCYQ